MVPNTFPRHERYPSTSLLPRWTFDCGDPCKQANAHLAKRGIPHTVRYANKEPEALKKLTGGTEVPVLLVGSTQLKGYLETNWDAALDSNRILSESSRRLIWTRG